MDQILAQKAIDSALSSSWEEAKDINLKILQVSPNDIDALNRLARAYAELGNMEKAKETSGKVLKLDPMNGIASRCFEKWNRLKNGRTEASAPVSPEAFLEEPGKTKLLPLLNPGDAKVVAGVGSGDEVFISPHPHRVSITTKEGKYLGRLPDDVAAKLRQLIKLGNKYRALVKIADGNEIKVFIRETEKSVKTEGLVSFPPEKLDYVSFTPPELVHKSEESISDEETEEPESL